MMPFAVVKGVTTPEITLKADANFACDAPTPLLCPDPTPWPSQCALIVSAVTLAMAIHVNAGTLAPRAIALLSVSIVALFAVPFLPARRPVRVGGVSLPHLLLGLGVLAQFLAILRPVMQMTTRSTFDELIPLLVSIGFALIATSLLFLKNRLCAALAFPCVIAAYLVCGMWAFYQVPLPVIDVFVFQNDGVAKLLDGANPYAMRFPDIYTPTKSALYYGPGVSVAGWLQYGYPYAPLTLLAGVPGYLAGDVRYSNLAAMAVAALLIGYARPGRISKLAAVLLLFTPPMLLLFANAWTEPFVIVMLAATWFCHCRRPRYMPWMLGLFLASKQYAILAMPLCLLLLDRPWRIAPLVRMIWRVAAAGLFVSLPLILWDTRAFAHSALLWQFRQPFRADSLSYLAWLRPANPLQWTWVAFAAMFATMAFVLAIGRRKRLPFPVGVAMLFMMFFAFNKQAFANYYYFVISALCIALAEYDTQQRPA